MWAICKKTDSILIGFVAKKYECDTLAYCMVPEYMTIDLIDYAPKTLKTVSVISLSFCK